MSLIEMIETAEDILSVTKNKVVGNPVLSGSSIQFFGENNILFCEKDVSISNSKIVFRGNNAVLYLCGSRHQYRLAVDLWGDTSISFGSNCYFNGLFHAIASERQSIVVGNDGLFSFGIWLRTADPHLLYDCDSGERLNNSKGIFVGDHVWIGQDALILKGSRLGSGSIVGARGVVSGKQIPSNTSWGGVPARELSKNVFFKSDSVHAYSREKTDASQRCVSKQYDFRCNRANGVFDLIEHDLTEAEKAADRVTYLQKVYADTGKHRFSIPETRESGKKVSKLKQALRGLLQ